MQYQEAQGPAISWWDQFRNLFSTKKVQEDIEEYDFANPEPFNPPRFESDDPKLAEYFHTNGYVVIKAVANESERATGVSLFWDLCEQQQPTIKRDDPATWGDAWVADSSVGIMSGYGIGQSAFMWYARLLPKVKQSFAHVWGTDDLLVSYDGCGVFRPPEHNPLWRTRGGWYHIDQNCYKRPGLHAVQGLVNFLPSGPHDGGFVVVPKSTHMIDQAFAAEGSDVCSRKGRDYVRMYPDATYWKDPRRAIKNRDETNRYDLLPVKIVLEAGDLVLWDSRAIHCNSPPTKDSTSPDAAKHLKRLASYICMTPAASAQNLEELVKYRIFAFQKGVTTTHWPHEFYPSWSVKDKLPGVGASVVKLTPEQATLITGKQLNWDVYDETITAKVDLDDLPY